MRRNIAQIRPRCPNLARQRPRRHISPGARISPDNAPNIQSSSKGVRRAPSKRQHSHGEAYTTKKTTRTGFRCGSLFPLCVQQVLLGSSLGLSLSSGGLGLGGSLSGLLLGLLGGLGGVLGSTLGLLGGLGLPLGGLLGRGLLRGPLALPPLCRPPPPRPGPAAGLLAGLPPGRGGPGPPRAGGRSDGCPGSTGSAR